MPRKGSHTPFLINRERMEEMETWVSFKATKSDIRLGRICYFRSQILQSVSLLCSLILKGKILQGTTQRQSWGRLDVLQPAAVNACPDLGTSLCPAGWIPWEIPNPTPQLSWQDPEQDWPSLGWMRWSNCKIALLKVTQEICTRARSWGRILGEPCEQGPADPELPKKCITLFSVP